MTTVTTKITEALHEVQFNTCLTISKAVYYIQSKGFFPSINNEV